MELNINQINTKQALKSIKIKIMQHKVSPIEYTYWCNRAHTDQICFTLKYRSYKILTDYENNNLHK